MKGLFSGIPPPNPAGMGFPNPNQQMAFPGFFLPPNRPNQQKQVAYHKNKWLPIEDELLLNAVKVFGTKNWIGVAEKVPGRTAKQCRERYTGQLDPNLTKEEWTTDEDNKLMKFHTIHGNQWSAIAKSLPGRSANAIKNRCNWLIKKKLMGTAKPEQATSQSQPMSADSFSFSDGTYSDPFSEVSTPKTAPTSDVPEDPFSFDLQIDNDLNESNWF